MAGFVSAVRTRWTDLVQNTANYHRNDELRGVGQLVGRAALAAIAHLACLSRAGRIAAAGLTGVTALGWVTAKYVGDDDYERFCRVWLADFTFAATAVATVRGVSTMWKVRGIEKQLVKEGLKNSRVHRRIKCAMKWAAVQTGVCGMICSAITRASLRS